MGKSIFLDRIWRLRLDLDVQAVPRLLTDRVERHYPIHGRQKAFRSGDGIGDNTYFLRNVMANRKAMYQSTNIAVLDVSEAFESVSHDSIFLAAPSAGIPGPLVTYIRYVGSRTSGWLTQPGYFSEPRCQAR